MSLFHVLYLQTCNPTYRLNSVYKDLFCIIVRDSSSDEDCNIPVKSCFNKLVGSREMITSPQAPDRFSFLCTSLDMQAGYYNLLVFYLLEFLCEAQWWSVDPYMR